MDTNISWLIMVMVIYLYTAYIHIWFMAVNNSFLLVGGEIGRQLVKVPLAVAISPQLISRTQFMHAYEGKTEGQTTTTRTPSPALF